MKARPHLAACLVAALGAVLPAQLRAEAPDFHLSGFATVGALVTDRSDVWAYRSGFNKPGRNRLDFGTDTLVGVQGSLRVGQASDFTVQAVSSETPHGDYDPRIAWAFWRYNVNAALTLRAGRLRAPFFMLSDSLNVNYAYPWVRPPQEVYGLNPFSEIDGADLLLRVPAGALELELKPYFGNGRIDLADDSRATLRDVRGINVALSGVHLSAHLSHGEGRLHVKWGDDGYRAVAAGLTQAGGALAGVPAQLAGDEGRARFSSAGLQWDDGRHLVIAEAVQRRVNRYVNSAQAWQLTVGQRSGSFTHFLTLARQRQDRPVARADIADPALAAGFAAFLASRNEAQRSVTVGTRWDFARNAAFKAQLSRARIDRDAWGSFFPGDPRQPPGGHRVHVLSLSLDVVF
ncbi:hypothetical protein [Pseudothauera rhizosphaerae]|uniref:Porin n=1 Tax=Pseudothauera rhizosphaerae TaxID=2565932 RepID=A0A4S4AYY4_9RHOO|nr:hypothetical protein [Pseudothauera rhizosphaerae]THF65368.1 hypothetical protein E6O51_01845 [Pseudothauera rhizosphaerae]